MSVYEFSAPLLNGEHASLSKWRGRVLLIVNTASACGFTPQYKGLEALHRELSPRGFAVTDRLPDRHWQTARDKNLEFSRPFVLE